MVDEVLLNILACPVCNSDLELQDKRIVCKGCARKYPVKNGIPIMLKEEAELDEKK